MYSKPLLFAIVSSGWIFSKNLPLKSVSGNRCASAFQVFIHYGSALQSKKSLHTRELQLNSHNDENTNQQTGRQLQHQKHSLENTQLKTKVQHIDKSRKPRLAVMCIGLVVAFGLAYWLMRKWRFA